MNGRDMYGGRRPKRAKASVGYAAESYDSTRCDGCRNFMASSACKLVAGEIAPGGWCRLWAKR
jgi:hypothetical protein